MSNYKPFVFLTLASLLLALAWLAFGWAGTGRAQAQAAVRKIEQSEQALATLKAQVAQWEKAGTQVVGSVEAVLLEAKFLPGELPRSAALLAGLYGDYGYFTLRRFSLAWGDEGAAGAGVGGADGAGVARMTVGGEKVFIGRRTASADISGGGR